MTDVTPLHKKGKKDLKQNYRSADTNYADDDTPYVIADDINGIITSLEKASKALFEWFENNLLKSNAAKCHLLVSSSVNLRVSNYEIKNSECEKLLGA